MSSCNPPGCRCPTAATMVPPCGRVLVLPPAVAAYGSAGVVGERIRLVRAARAAGHIEDRVALPERTSIQIGSTGLTVFASFEVAGMKSMSQTSLTFVPCDVLLWIMC